MTKNANQEKREFYAPDLQIGGSVMSNGSIKAPRHQLEHAFFAQNCRHADVSSRYDYQGTTISIKCSRGVPHAGDSDVLVFLTSKAMWVKTGSHYDEERRAHAPKEISFTPSEFFRFAHRSSGGKSYTALLNSCDRLFDTWIETNIESGGEVEVGKWRYLSNVKFVYTKDGVTSVVNENAEEMGKEKGRRLQNIVVELSDWLWRIIDDEQVLVLSDKYFEISNPFDRRTYELARKHVGRQNKFEISLDKLQIKHGSKLPKSKFKNRIKKIIDDERCIPDYKLAFGVDKIGRENGNVVFLSKANGIEEIPARFKKRTKELHPTSIEFLKKKYSMDSNTIYGMLDDFIGLMKNEGKAIENVDLDFASYMAEQYCALKGEEKKEYG